MSGGDGYLTNPLYREIAKMMTDAGIPHRVEQGAKHFHVKFEHMGVERTQILHLGPNNKGSTRRKTIIRFRKIVDAERAWREQQSSPELNLEQPAMSEQCPPEPSEQEDDGSVEFGPVVSLKDGRPTTTSRNIAADFGKSHRDVLRAIDNLIKMRPELAPRNFAQGVYTLPETGDQQHRCFEMDRDGFALLAMGFTGERALSWKLSYLGAFNAMEAEIRRLAAPAVASIDTDTMKTNAQLAASAAGGAAKNAIANVRSEVARLNERFDKQARFTQEMRREVNSALVELNGRFSGPISAVALHAAEYIEIGGVYDLSGVRGPIRNRALLTNNIKSSLGSYCRQKWLFTPEAPLRGQMVIHWPKSAVADWLVATGHALIERHLRANAPKAELLSFKKPSEGGA